MGRVLAGLVLSCFTCSMLLSGCSRPGDHDLRLAAAAGDEERVAEALKKLRVLVETNQQGEILSLDASPLREYFDRNLSDADLGALAKLASSGGLQHLEQLDLTFCQELTDAACGHIARLPGLRDLSLARVPITDAGLKRLAPLDALRKLNLDVTNISAAGLHLLTSFTQLQSLSLRCAKIDDDAIQPLSTISDLEILILSDVSINGSGLACLEALPNLKTLDLATTKVPAHHAGNLLRRYLEATRT